MMRIIQTDKITPEDLKGDGGLWIYNAIDCCVTSEVLDALLPQLTSVTAGTYKFSRELLGPILDMNLRGVLVDQQRRDEVLASYHADVERLTDQLNRIIREGIGFDFTVSKGRKYSFPSDDQLKTLFFDILGLPEITKVNDKGERVRTVDRKALEKIEHYFYAEPIVKHLLMLRELAKKISFLNTECDPDGRMRTSFNIAGTTTGRLSSAMSDMGTGGNLQNVNNRMRSIFIADPGYKFCNIDLEQGDSRGVGAIHWNLFRDPAYLDACESSDLHTTVAMGAFPNLPWTNDIKENRKIAESQKFYRDMNYRDAAKRLGHGCLTEDHEVLTPSGWVPITAKPSIIMTFSPEKSEFAETTVWTDIAEWQGYFYIWEGLATSAVMTSTHRILYVTPNADNFKFCLVGQLPKSAKIPTGWGWVGGNATDVTPAIARLIAAYQCDGYYGGAGKQIRFHFHKDRKFARLQNLADEAEVKWIMQGGDKIALEVDKPTNWPKKAGAYLLTWSKESIEAYLDEMPYWDGHIGEGHITLFSTDRIQLEWIQTCNRLLGKGGNISKSYESGFGSKVYRLQVNNRKYIHLPFVEEQSVEYKTARVLCPTVPSGAFYIRRNGKISVTGNSNYRGHAEHMARETHIPPYSVKEFQYNYFKRFPSFKYWWEHVERQIRDTRKLTTLLGRQRYFFGDWREDSTINAAIAYEPQSITADTIDKGLLAIWRANRVQLLLQVHDSILFQYPEEQEDEIVPWALETIRQRLILKEGREFVIPGEAKVGWSWTDMKDDPDGLRKYFDPSRPRQRTREPRSVWGTAAKYRIED